MYTQKCHLLHFRKLMSLFPSKAQVNRAQLIDSRMTQKSNIQTCSKEYNEHPNSGST